MPGFDSICQVLSAASLLTFWRFSGLCFILFSMSALSVRFLWGNKKNYYYQIQPTSTWNVVLKSIQNSYTCIYLATWLSCCRSLRFMFMVRCDFKSWFFINIYLNNMLCSITKLQYTINDTEMKANRQLRVKPLYLKFLWDFLIKTIITNCLPPQLQ